MKNVNILIVEDNEGDVILAKEALKDAKVSNTISVAKDGEIALDMLFKRGQYEEFLTPDLILLDINLPRVNGLEVLKMIKSDAQLRKIPVVMLTSSAAEVDITEAYNNHVNCYVTKPAALDSYMHVMTGVENFWLGLAKLPSKVNNTFNR